MKNSSTQLQTCHSLQSHGPAQGCIDNRVYQILRLETGKQQESSQPQLVLIKSAPAHTLLTFLVCWDVEHVFGYGVDFLDMLIATRQPEHQHVCAGP